MSSRSPQVACLRPSLPLLIFGLALLFAGTFVTTHAQTNYPISVGRGILKLGEAEQPTLTESSGLVASLRYPGVLWTHNDNAEPIFLYAIDQTGKHLGAFEVQGAALIDWEATALGPDGYLYLADTGTNGLIRSHSAIHRIEEPEVEDRSGAARVLETWYIRFPGEREDCESLFIHGGYAYLIAKYRINGRVRLYRFPLSSEEDSILLELVTTIEAEGDVSDASLSPDNIRLGLVTDEGIEIIFINGNPVFARMAPRQVVEFSNNDMEGGTFSTNGFLTTAETNATASTSPIFLFTSPRLSGAPGFTTLLQDQTVFVGGTAEFRVNAFGFPAPTFQWTFNGQVLPGQTNSFLILTNVTLADAGIYSVTITNPNGTATSTARLTVLERNIDVRVTEIMSSPAAGTSPTADWWELTNFDTNVVNLSGWRFNDSEGGLADAFVFPTNLTLRPGESVIFVEDLSPEEFRTWWGGTNFAPGTQIITYPEGMGFGFAEEGDSVRIWDNTATSDATLYIEVPFGQATTGVTFTYNPDTDTFGELSQIGIHGAFRATTGPDIGSPGRIRNPPDQRVDLRITEVMSSQHTNTVPSTADWWELTSFASVPIDLSGWRFNDNDGGLIDAFVLPEGLVIQPGESIIFVERLTPEEFLNWWGDENFPPGTTIVTYSGPGLSFSSEGDSLRIWNAETTDENAVALRADFGAADLGVSFIYNPDTGIFPEKSVPGVHGAFVAAIAPDVGSPGRIRELPGRAPNLRITEVMSDESPGSAPTADWWELTSFDSEPIDLSGWRFNENTGGLSDPAVIPEGLIIQPGESIVFVQNLTPEQFRTWWGANNLTRTRIISYSGTQIGLSDQGDALFLWDALTTDPADTVDAVFYPAASEGVSFTYNPDTGSFGDLSRVNVNGAFQASTGPEIGSPGRISGETVRLLDLRITEVMSSQDTNSVITTADWWELTSFESQPISLAGWRFNDNTGGLTDPYVIPGGVDIQPGETIIFVEDLSPAQFRAWWGSEVLSPNLQIISYTQDGLGLNAGGDGLRLWDNTTTNEALAVARVDFIAADPGVTFIYNPITETFGEKAQLGVFGVFTAAGSNDIGSPGIINDETANGFALSASASGNSLLLSFPAEADRTYSLEMCDDLNDGIWVPSGDSQVSTSNGFIEFNQPRNGPARFYRVRKN